MDAGRPHDEAAYGTTRPPPRSPWRRSEPVQESDGRFAHFLFVRWKIQRDPILNEQVQSSPLIHLPIRFRV